MGSNLKTDSIWVEVTGKGDTKDRAVEDAFKEMRREVGKRITHPVVALRTMDVVLLDVQKEEREEAYLFVFMKRTVENWKIKAKIQLEIDYVDFERGTGE